jgi:NAD(P)-dependent dehydrogenase (short-subunit alcohol dehydrogenase family)
MGAAIVRDLAAHGWAVAIHCNRSASEAGALAAEISTAGCRAVVVTGELADEGALTALVPQAVARLGPLTLLVNNASVFLEDRVGALDFSLWRTQLDINLRAPVFLAEAFARQLSAGTAGNIVNLIDQRVLNLTPEMTSYTLSKAALWTATQTLAQALAPSIRVNAIAPGPTFANWRDGEGGMSREVETTLLKRTVDPADIARAVRFCVDNTSMTGQLIAIDSGQHLSRGGPQQ